jgi:hypothetical protein
VLIPNRNNSGTILNRRKSEKFGFFFIGNSAEIFTERILPGQSVAERTIRQRKRLKIFQTNDEEKKNSQARKSSELVLVLYRIEYRRTLQDSRKVPPLFVSLLSQCDCSSSSFYSHLFVLRGEVAKLSLFLSLPHSLFQCQT